MRCHFFKGTTVLSALFMASWASMNALAGPIVKWTDPDGFVHFYELIDKKLNWSVAKTTAEAMTYNGLSGHLVTLTSQEENAVVLDAFNEMGIHAAWIGLTDNEAYGGVESGGPSNPAAPFWVWVTGELVSYTNWFPGEPNNLFGEDYGELVFDVVGGFWNDLSGFEPYHYIVEYVTLSPVPEPSTALVLGIGLGLGTVFNFLRKWRPGGRG